MNLYTEQQMRDAIKMARNGARSEDNIIDSLNFIKQHSEVTMNNKKTTALNEHLEWLKKELKRVIDDGESESWVYAYKKAIKHAESMLNKEKQIIIDAIITCEKEHYVHSTVYPPQFVIDKAEQYYKQTYGGNNGKEVK